MKGVMDYPLDATGKREAKKLAKRVSALKPDIVISSPLKRAAGPAKEIAKAAGVPLQISDEFLPIDLGELHGKSMDEGEPKLKQAATEHPDKPVAKGGESFNHFLRTKVRPGFQKIKDLIAQGKRPVVVTHSRNLRNLRYGMFGAKPSDPTTGGPEPAGFVTLRGKKLQIHPDGGTSGE
jgi:broad specificity phosphatase PhoE